MQAHSTVAHCQFVAVAAGRWECANCNYKTSPKRRYDKPPIRQCPNAPDLLPAAERLAEETGDPTIVEKMTHYAGALFHFAASGFKTRTDAEVERIYTEHCRPCEQFDSQADACTICGCNVRVEGVAVRNMIAMATEHCSLPAPKW